MCHALLVSLGHHDLSETLEQWANCLLKFHELYQCRAIPESTQNTLQVDLNLQDKLHALVDEIHMSPTLQCFKGPVDPACSFHVQCEELIEPQDPVPASVFCQQEELNAASNILKALNQTRELFNQPAACTIGLRPLLENNDRPLPGGSPPNGGSPGGWGPEMDAFSPQCSGSNHYYYYYNAAPPPHNPDPQDNIHDALMHEGKLNIQKLKPFHGCDPCKWRTFLTQCLTMFQAKPLTFQLESSCGAFATLYLQGITFDYYMVLLWFDPNSPVLSNWQVFAQEFLSKFGVFDTVAEAKENLFNLQMRNDKWFTTFIVHFEKKAYKTGWNYNALWFALCHALPQCIKDILHLAPKQPSYDSYKALVTQINQRYWEDCSKYSASWAPWNSFRNSDWQSGATAGNQTTGAAPPPNSAAQPPLGQGPANVN
ncbi:hypothetical protein C0993_005944 [Termitomyces sp. T159_Od127]|nr:hypothetical protein C0993_005944 [Termitomyces sp. T159_Od127]